MSRPGNSAIVAILFLVGLLGSAGAAAGQEVPGEDTPCVLPTDPVPEPGFWEPVTGPGTNWALDVAFDANDPSRILLAGSPNGPVPGGVYLSTDEGETWTRGRGTPPDLHVFNVEFSTANPKIMFAAVDPGAPPEWYMRSATYANSTRVYRSIDTGKTWCPIATLTGTPLRMLTDPRAPGRVWVSTSGAVLSGGEYESRVYRSDDDGLTWTASSGLKVYPGSAEAFDLVTGPTPEDMMAATPSGAYLSSDGGRTWSNANMHGGDPAYVTVRDIGVDPRDPRIAYTPNLDFLFGVGVNETHRVTPATVAFSKIYKTTDFGRSWERLDQLLMPTNADRLGGGKCVPPGLYSMEVTPEGTLVVGSLCGVFVSRDAGESWTHLSETPGSVRTPRVEVGPSGDVWALSMGQGVFRSTDDGLTFARVAWGWAGGGTTDPERDNGHVCQIQPLGQARLLASCGWPNSAYTVVRSEDGGRTWHQVEALRSALVTGFAADATSPNVVLAGTKTDGLFRSADGGRSWAAVAGVAGSTTALAAAPSRSGTLYASTAAVQPFVLGNGLFGENVPAGIWRTRDGGLTWSLMGTAPTATLLDLKVSASDPNVLFVGGSDLGFQQPTGGLWRSADAGRTWTRATGIPETQSVIAVGFVPGHPEVVLASAGEVYRSTDGGLTFQPAQGPGAAFAPPRMFAAQPGLPGVAYLATEQGVFRSGDAGVTWLPAEGGLDGLEGLAGARGAWADPDDPRGFFVLAGGFFSNGGNRSAGYGKFLFHGHEA